MLKLVLRVGQILTANGIEIFYNRTTDVFENVTIKARKANAAGVDFFASFHRNAANGVAKGSETLVYSNTGKAKICADRANQKMQECGFTQRGTKVRTDLVVLNSTKMPAVLFETGFIDHGADNALFDSQFEKIAQGYAEAIALTVGSTLEDTGVAKPPIAAQKPPLQNSDIAVDYGVMLEGGRRLPTVRNLTDFAGLAGRPIVGFLCRPTKGSVKYRVHLLGKGWLDWVTGFDWNDFYNGYGGDGKTPIDAVEVYLYSPDNDQYMMYRVAPVGGPYYPYQRDNEKNGNMDGYAGVFGKAIDRIQMYVSAKK